MSRSRSLLAVAMGVAFAATPALGAGSAVTVADSGTPATRIAAELTGGLLGARVFTVTRVGFGSPAAADAALRAGTIDLYTTQTATLLERVLHRPKERNANRLPGVLSALLAPRQGVLLGLAPYDDAPRVACRRSVLRGYRISGLRTLIRGAGKISYAATPAHVVRADGLSAIGVRFKRVLVRPGNARFDFVARRRAQCVLSSGVDPWAARLGLVALTDRSRKLAGTPQRGVSVVSQPYLATAPAAFVPAVDQAAGLLTPDVTRTLIGQVEIDGQDPAAVAQTFLRAAGLVP